jgi:hypothetical protein
VPVVKDWLTWHDRYDDPTSNLSRRLGAVQERIRIVLDAAPPGPLRIVSACAGQGRDLLPVLAAHPRRDDVTARLVELDPRNAELATAAVAGAGLTGVEVRLGDASRTSQYADLAPADLVLMCGVYGNISDADIRATAGYCAALCATGGAVVWTRHRRDGDLLPTICGWYEEVGFTTEWVSADGLDYGVAVHRLTGPSRPLPADETMFRFIGHANLPT